MEAAVLQGNEAARWRLGELHASGAGVPRDVELAFRMYEVSAEAGERQGMLRLARSYRFALGTNANKIRSWAWYNVAATELRIAADERAKLESEMSASEGSLARLESIRILQHLFGQQGYDLR